MNSWIYWTVAIAGIGALGGALVLAAWSVGFSHGRVRERHEVGWIILQRSFTEKNSEVAIVLAKVARDVQCGKVLS